MTESEISKRTELAISLFATGYNCSQSVLMAFADLYGIEKDLAAKVATSFGGGMGRLREVCGALSGGFMVLGFEFPFTDVKDRDSKNKNYKKVQQLARDFEKQMGSYNCAELLHLKREAQNPESELRTKEYYASRPCIRCIALAAELTGKMILDQK